MHGTSTKSRKTLTATAAAILFTLTLTATADVPDDDFDWAIIRDPGNPAFPGDEDGALVGRGSVDYIYRISKMEITTGQVLEFLNTFTPQSDELAELLGRIRSGAITVPFYPGPGDLYYLAPSIPHAELTGVKMTWQIAAMYCNWLHNGKSSDPASIMDGAYDVSTFSDDLDHDTGWTDQAAHHPDARFWIPTLDEWLKAVHYHPDKDGQGPGWFYFPHGKDAPPIPGLPGQGDMISGVSDEEVEAWGALSHYRFPLGMYTEVRSPWGLLDTIGGRSEWLEDWYIAFGIPFNRLAKGSMNGSDNPYDPVNNDRIGLLRFGFPTSMTRTLRVASPHTCGADLDAPFGDLDLRDIVAFVRAYEDGRLLADLAEPHGVFTTDDITAFVGAFLGGCD